MVEQFPSRPPLPRTMLPATRQGFVTAFVNLRAKLAQAEGATNQTEMLTIAFEAIQAGTRISEALVDKLSETMDDHANHIAAHVSDLAKR